MKRTIPLLITLLSGMILIVASFIPYAQDWKTDVLIWFDILATIAFVLGGGNLLMMHLKKVSDRPPGWGYSVVTLTAFVVTMVVGTIKLGSHPTDQAERYGQTAAPLRLEDFPKTFDAVGTFPEVELPPDVKGQLTSLDGTISFRGWMTPPQRAELESAEYEADWHRTVADLFAKAQPPAELKDKVQFHAQLDRLFFRGAMSAADRDALAGLSQDANWTEAVETLYTHSNRQHSVPLDELPSGYTIPDALRGTIAFDADAKMLRVTGPMSDAQHDALVNNFPPGTLLTKAEKEQLKASLAALGPLDPELAIVIDEFTTLKDTVGQRNQELLFALLQAARVHGGADLNGQQRDFLLTQYNLETQWRVKVGELFAAAHEVKYPFSGQYDDEGSAMWYVYEFAFRPLTSTMFALLAFYVASAAFRAFRAKNIEASLLLGTAFIVLLGRTYLGTAMTAWMPEELSALTIPGLTLIIMSVFLTAGNRAIMIGIALGIVSTSLKILLGIDRSYLGSDRE